jgi:hypothetical protein
MCDMHKGVGGSDDESDVCRGFPPWTHHATRCTRNARDAQTLALEVWSHYYRDLAGEDAHPLTPSSTSREVLTRREEGQWCSLLVPREVALSNFIAASVGAPSFVVHIYHVGTPEYDPPNGSCDPIAIAGRAGNESMVAILLRANNKLNRSALNITTVAEAVANLELCDCQLCELLREDDTESRDACFLRGACKMRGSRPTSVLAADGERIDTRAVFSRCSAYAHTAVTFTAGGWESTGWGFLGVGDARMLVVGAPIPMTAGDQALQVTLGQRNGRVVATVLLSLSMFSLVSNGMGEYGGLVCGAHKGDGGAQLQTVPDWSGGNVRIRGTVRTTPDPSSPRGIVQPGIDTYYITGMELPLSALDFPWSSLEGH